MEGTVVGEVLVPVNDRDVMLVLGPPADRRQLAVRVPGIGMGSPTAEPAS